jgi:hypothetical protein
MHNDQISDYQKKRNHRYNERVTTNDNFGQQLNQLTDREKVGLFLLRTTSISLIVAMYKTSIINQSEQSKYFHKKTHSAGSALLLSTLCGYVLRVNGFVTKGNAVEKPIVAVMVSSME